MNSRHNAEKFSPVNEPFAQGIRRAIDIATSYVSSEARTIGVVKFNSECVRMGSIHGSKLTGSISEHFSPLKPLRRAEELRSPGAKKCPRMVRRHGHQKLTKILIRGRLRSARFRTPES